MFQNSKSSQHPCGIHPVSPGLSSHFRRCLLLQMPGPCHPGCLTAPAIDGQLSHLPWLPSPLENYNPCQRPLLPLKPSSFFGCQGHGGTLSACTRHHCCSQCCHHHLPPPTMTYHLLPSPALPPLDAPLLCYAGPQTV